MVTRNLSLKLSLYIIVNKIFKIMYRVIIIVVQTSLGITALVTQVALYIGVVLFGLLSCTQAFISEDAYRWLFKLIFRSYPD